MLRFVLLLTLFLFLIPLEGCANPKNDRADISVQPTHTISIIPTPSIAPPEQGLATIIGRLISAETGKPLTNTVVRLAEVYYTDENSSPANGIYVLDNAFDPSSITNEDGFFVFTNIEARDYVIIVGDIHLKYTVISNQDGTPKVWTIQPNQIIDLGTIQVEF